MRLLRGLSSTGEPQHSHHRRDVDAEPAAQSLLQPVPAADGVVRGARPRFHRSLGGRLLLVGGAEEHPVAVGLEHRVEIVQAANVVAELRLPYPHDQRRRVELPVTERRELGSAAGRLQRPWLFSRAAAFAPAAHISPLTSHPRARDRRRGHRQRSRPRAARGSDPSRGRAARPTRRPEARGRSA